MDLKKRIQRLEDQAAARVTQPKEHTLGAISDDQRFWFCHGFFPKELKDQITREVRQYKENGFRVTIILEAVK